MSMNNSYEARLALAGRMYDLDAEVYQLLGSGLGRVYNGKRERTVRELADVMGDVTKAHYLRSEMALIGNMARTIPDRTDRARIMSVYNDILKQIEELPTSFAHVDIKDEKMASLNLLNLENRFSKDNHLIICISRTYGSGGTHVGFDLADKLKINYYDTEIFTEVLERLEAEKESVRDHASFAHKQNMNQNLGIEKRSLKEHIKEFNRYHGLSKADAVFFNQSDLLNEMAHREDFIIMGRCADVILTNLNIPHVSIYITAPFEQRVRYVMGSDELDYKGAVKLLKKMDRKHGNYYKFYTGRKWGNPVNYDLCINTSSYGVEGAVQLIEGLVNRTRKK